MAPGGQPLQSGETSGVRGRGREGRPGAPGPCQLPLGFSSPSPLQSQTAPGALDIFSVVTWAAALRAFPRNRVSASLLRGQLAATLALLTAWPARAWVRLEPPPAPVVLARAWNRVNPDEAVCGG